MLRNGVLLSNVTASQAVHEAYGGVVPELASRAHQQNVVPVVSEAIKRAGITKEQLTAVAFTRGPGLMGSLLVGVNFAKGFARSLGIPLIDVNHLQGHVMAHFIKESDDDRSQPPLPFICLLVSGGNSQIVLVRAYNDMEVLGQTIDDAAGEAIDKCSKVMGLGYPGGPIIDKLARQGNPKAYQFAEPHIPGLDYSFSGLKTSFLYNLRKWVEDDPDFVEHHKKDIAASLEWTIVDILMKKLKLAVNQTGVTHVAVAGGVSANNGLRNAFHDYAHRFGWTVYIPKFSYVNNMDFESKVFSREISQLLWEMDKTVSTAESCTGGRIAEAIIAVPGASKYFKGGIISYVDEVKMSLLGVSGDLLAEKTAVCEEVAQQMVKGACKTLNTDYAIAARH